MGIDRTQCDTRQDAESDLEVRPPIFGPELASSQVLQYRFFLRFSRRFGSGERVGGFRSG